MIDRQKIQKMSAAYAWIASQMPFLWNADMVEFAMNVPWKPGRKAIIVSSAGIRSQRSIR